MRLKVRYQADHPAERNVPVDEEFSHCFASLIKNFGAFGPISRANGLGLLSARNVSKHMARSQVIARLRCCAEWIEPIAGSVPETTGSAVEQIFPFLGIIKFVCGCTVRGKSNQCTAKSCVLRPLQDY